MRFILALFLCLLSASAFAADLWRPGGEPAFVDSNGNPYSGGKLYFYDANTSDPRTVYKDADATLEWTQPITLDSAGRLESPIFIPTGDFKEVFKNSAGTTIYTFDDLPGAFDQAALEVEFAKPERPVIAKASNYTITEDDLGSLVAVNATGGNVTITIPVANDAGDGATLVVKKIDSGVNTVTIATTGGETIDGATTYVLSVQYKDVGIVSDGVGWHIETIAGLSGYLSATELAADSVAASEIAASAVGTSEINDGTVADADLRNGTALSVMGRSANSSGAPADIACSAGSDDVIRESGSVLGCGTVTTGGLSDLGVTFGKLAASAYDNDTTLAANSATVLPTQQAVKAYVDAAAVGSIQWKDPVRAATTVDGTLASAFDDASVVDGVTLATSDRLMWKRVPLTLVRNGRKLRRQSLYWKQTRSVFL
jgi:hypothetical protein